MKQSVVKADSAVQEYKPMNIQEKDYLTVKDLQSYLGFGKNKIYTLVNQNDFPKIKIGKNFLIPKEELNIYLKRKIYKTIDM